MDDLREVEVPETWLCPLFNNDDSGMTDEDKAEYQKWREGFDGIPIDHGETYFTSRCEVTGLGGMCCVVTFH